MQTPKSIRVAHHLMMKPEQGIRIGAAGAAMGLLLVVCLAIVSPSVPILAVLGVLGASSGALLLAFSWNAAARQQTFQSEFDKIRRDLFRIGERNDLGLVEVSDDATRINYEDIIVSARVLTIVLNEGRSWVAQHGDQLRRRFRDHKDTRFFLIDPSSPVVPILARKAGTESETVRARISDAVRMIEDIARETGGDVTVYGHRLYNSYACCLSESEAILVPYFSARGTGTLPAFRFMNSGAKCYHRELTEDVERLLIDSEYLLAPTNNEFGRAAE